LLVLLLTMTGLPTLAQAHDIGIAKAELRERDGNRYELNVWTGPATAYLFQSPKLPDMCRFDGNPRGAQGTDRLGFAFTCNESLTANDRLHLPWKREGVMLTARWQDGNSVKRLFRREAGYIQVELSALQAGSGSWSYAAKRYLALGIEHILLGIDHLLFVACLMFVAGSGRRLLVTITGFTIAHSITLALSALDLVRLPVPPVEAVIALSIVFLAMEIARGKRDSLTYRYPIAVSASFGLLHGFGFAAVLREIGLPQTEIPTALLFFNIGVEIGQILFVTAVIAVFLGAVFLTRKLKYQYVTKQLILIKVERPAAYIVGSLASFWMIERITGFWI